MTDLPIRQGNTASFWFECRDETGAPFPLTGSDFVFTASWRGTTIVKTVGDGLSVPTPSNGRVKLELGVDDTRSVPPGALMEWELERRIDGSERTIASGRFSCEKGINADV